MSLPIGTKLSVIMKTASTIAPLINIEPNVNKNTNSILVSIIFFRLIGYENSKIAFFPRYSSTINFDYIVAEITEKIPIMTTNVSPITKL